MERINLLCEVGNCGQTATVFGLVDSQKIKSCEEHMPSLMSKKAQVIDISGYHFIENLSDAVAFAARKATADKGIGNFTVLEASCDIELTQAMQIIENAKKGVMETIDCRFEEIKAAVTGTHEEVKRQLSLLQGDLMGFLSDKNCELSPTALSLCGQLSFIPRFLRFGIADVSDKVSAALSDCWSVATPDINATLKCVDGAQKIDAIQSALTEALESAKRGIPQALEYANVLIGEESMFEREKEQVMLETLQWEKRRIEESWKWLQRSWGLRQKYPFSNKITVDIGQRLASILSLQCGRSSEADDILQHCQILEFKENPQSERSVWILNEISGVYIASERLDQAEAWGFCTLQTLPELHLFAEKYWTALLHLVYSMRLQGKHQPAEEVYAKWRNPRPAEESKWAEMTRLITSGIDSCYSQEAADAEKSLLEARRIGISHFPTSPFTALALFLLASVSNTACQERYYRQAQAIYDVVAPKSVQAAQTKISLGHFYRSSQRWSEAEECYQRAQAIYSITAPQSVGAARNYCSIGDLYGELGRWSEAEQCYRQAQSIYKAAAAKSAEAAANAHNLGCLYQAQKRWTEAEECYRQADSVLAATGPKSESAGKNQYCLGNLYADMKRWGEAEDCWKLAQSIYETAAPASFENGKLLHNIGGLHMQKKRWSKAEDCYRQAQSILLAAAPGSIDAAANLSSMGQLYQQRKKWSEAEGCSKEAQKILETAAPQSILAAKNLGVMGALSQQRKQGNEAENYWKRARAILEVAAPQSVEAAENYYNLGVLYQGKKQTTEAMECFEKAAQIYGLNGETAKKSTAEEQITRLQRNSK